MSREKDSTRNTPARFELLDVTFVFPSPLNPRTEFDREALEDLAISIRAVGVQSPIGVRVSPAGLACGYEIIWGERRWRASQLAGVRWIPAMVYDEMTDAEHLELALVENLQRRDINPIDEARGYEKLRELGYTQRAIAEKVGRSQPAVANALRVLELPSSVVERVAGGELTTSHAIALARWKQWPKVAEALAGLAVARKLAVRDLEQKGLPLSWELQQSGAVRRVSYNASFDETVCATCPFEAHLKTEFGSWCLRVEHFDELQAAAQREHDEQVAQQTGVDVAELEGAPVYSWMQHRMLDREPPEGCSDACTCRGVARVGDRVQPVCTDPERYDGLEKAESERKRAEAAIQKAAAAREVLSTVPAEWWTRELVLLLMGLSFEVPVELMEELGRMGFDLPQTEWEEDESEAALYEAIARLPFEAVRDAAIAAVVKLELGRYGGSPVIDWYLGRARPTSIEEREELEEAIADE